MGEIIDFQQATAKEITQLAHIGEKTNKELLSVLGENNGTIGHIQNIEAESASAKHVNASGKAVSAAERKQSAAGYTSHHKVHNHPGQSLLKPSQTDLDTASQNNESLTIAIECEHTKQAIIANFENDGERNRVSTSGTTGDFLVEQETGGKVIAMNIDQLKNTLHEDTLERLDIAA